jgi:hypothetical protein
LKALELARNMTMANESFTAIMPSTPAQDTAHENLDIVEAGQNELSGFHMTVQSI